MDWAAVHVSAHTQMRELAAVVGSTGVRATELCTLQVMPLQDPLIAAYRERFIKQDAELVRRQAHLKGLPQSFFGISDLSTSRDGWSQAVDALSDLDDALHVTPNMRLKILMYVKVRPVAPNCSSTCVLLTQCT